MRGNMLLFLFTAASLLSAVYAEENLAVGTPLLVSSWTTRPPSCSNSSYPANNTGVGNTTTECNCIVTNGSIPTNTRDWYATKLPAASLVSSVRISGINTSIDVLVGYEFAANMSLAEFSLCTRYNAADNAQKVNCNSPVRGSVVALRALNDTSQLHICGVDVFGTSRNMLLATPNISWHMWSLTPAPQELPWRLVDGNVTSCVDFNWGELGLVESAPKFLIPDGVSRPFRVVVYHTNVPLDALKATSFCDGSRLEVSIITKSSPAETSGINCKFVTGSVASSVAEYECTCPQDCHGQLTFTPFRSSISLKQQWRICEVVLFPQCLAGTFAPAGAATCTVCPAGTAAPAGAANCTVCPAGVATCTSCPAGTYQNVTGQASCVDCVAGTSSSTVGATNAATCANCTAGQTSAAGAATCHVPYQKCVRQATIINTNTCTTRRVTSACPLHYDSDKTTYVGDWLDYYGVCGAGPSCACQTGFTYDSGSKRCARNATIINTNNCTTSRVQSGCPLHYDSDKTTYVGTELDYSGGCGAGPLCACQTGFTYDSASNKCVRQATIISTSPCTTSRVLSGCPLHYDSDKTTYVGCKLDWGGCGVGLSCACQTGYTWDSGSNRCVRQTTIINTSSCTTKRVQSACPLHYDSDKTTYVGTELDYYGGCGTNSSCACQTGFTYDSASNKCARNATIINTSSCTSTRMQSACPLHYDSDKTTYVGTNLDWSGCGASNTCACQPGYDLIVV